MAVHDKINVVELLPDHLLLDIDLKFSVNQSCTILPQPDDLFKGKPRKHFTVVNIARHCFYGSNGPELIEDGKRNDISRMQDKIDAAKNIV